jgi:prephenate dehydratase
LLVPAHAVSQMEAEKKDEKKNAYLDVSSTVFEPLSARFQFSVGHEAGQLREVLDVLARHRISLTYIESQV